MCWTVSSKCRSVPGIPSRDYNKDLKTFLEVPWLIGAVTRLSSESSKRKVGQDRPWVIRLDSDERQLTMHGSSCVSTLTAPTFFPEGNLLSIWHVLRIRFGHSPSVVVRSCIRAL